VNNGQGSTSLEGSRRSLFPRLSTFAASDRIERPSARMIEPSVRIGGRVTNRGALLAPCAATDSYLLSPPWLLGSLQSSSRAGDSSVSARRSVPVADGAAAGVAVACAAHCVMGPWLVSVLPLLGPVVATERTEAAFLVASLTLSGATLLSARCRAHTCWSPIALFVLAALVLLATRVIDNAERPLGGILLVSAACLMTMAHGTNIRCCRHAARCRCYSGPSAGSAMASEPLPRQPVTGAGEPLQTGHGAS
jgi:hypothetical protein